MFEKIIPRTLRRVGSRTRPSFKLGRSGSSGLFFEKFESRRLFAADLEITGFASDGVNLNVTYSISGGNASAFDIGVYQSLDGVSLDALIGEVRVTNQQALAQGTNHSAAIPPAFSDAAVDYRLIAKLDFDSEVAEPDETNNAMVFSGGVFRSTDGMVHVHGSSAADSVSLSSASSLEVVFNCVNYSFATSGVSGIHMRLHGGNDMLAMDSAVDKVIWAFGGEGADTLTGGYGGDVLAGGPGDDLIHGGSGADLIYGNEGLDTLIGQAGNDTVFGGDGNDSITGDDGDDLLRGEAGNDSINGGDGNDVAYGGAGNDLLIGGYGDDALYGEDGGDSIFGDSGNDSIYGGDGDDAAYGSYGGYGGYGGSGGYGEIDDIDGGIGIDTIVAVESSEIADKPYFESFRVRSLGNNEWEVAGKVVDNDGSVAGRSVSIWGVFSTSVTVDSTGNFSKVVTLSPGVSGYVYALFVDEENLESPVPMVFI
jgi:hypothetical protein